MSRHPAVVVLRYQGFTPVAPMVGSTPMFNCELTSTEFGRGQARGVFDVRVRGDGSVHMLVRNPRRRPAAPRTTDEIAAAPFKTVPELKATVGSMNYELPVDLDLDQFRSLVIWCEITRNAYAAADLNR